jgi:hypothetical protein
MENNKKHNKTNSEANVYDRNYIMPREIADEADIYSEDSVSVGNDASPDPPAVFVVNQNQNNNANNEESEEVVVYAEIFNMNGSERSADSSSISGQKVKHKGDKLDKSLSQYSRVSKYDEKSISKDSVKKGGIYDNPHSNSSERESVHIELQNHRDHNAVQHEEVREQDISIKFKEHVVENSSEKKVLTEGDEKGRLRTENEVDHLLLNVNNEFLRNEDEFIGNVDLDNEELIRNVN